MKISPNDIFDRKPPRISKPRVLIDLDGVIRDFVGQIMKVYKREFPDHAVLPVTSRKLEQFFPIGDRIYQFIENGHINEIMLDAPAYPGALEALHYWKSVFDIVIVTAQPEITRAATYSWIGKYDVPANEVIVSFYKSEMEGLALLDDFIDNLLEFSNTGRLAVCLDQPWNQNWDGARVGSVNDFFKFLESKLNQKTVDQINSKNLT